MAAGVEGESVMEQILLHLIGDYVTQSDWMAQNKTKRWWPAFCHATVYSLPFLLIASWPAWLVIWSTHMVIDRFRLARYVAWAKNFMGAKAIQPCLCCTAPSVCPQPCSGCPKYRNHPWSECSGTGYHKDTPAWLAVWLMIACDNTLHLCINFAALKWL